MSRPVGPGRAGARVTAAGWGTGSWMVERLHGAVSDLLEVAEPPEGTPRLARMHTVDRPGLVLGSTQKLTAADQNQASTAGAEVLRRRSGGGAVLLAPGGQVWVDFFVPAADPLWSDDVSHAALWVGELWSAVIEPFVAETISIYSGRLVADRWGRLVCFAGAGPGEVFVGGLKVVGISQRRSRHRARIQTTARVRLPSATEGHDTAGHRLDELELLDLASSDRAAGRAATSGRIGAIAASETDLTAALLKALEGPR